MFSTADSKSRIANRARRRGLRYTLAILIFAWRAHCSGVERCAGTEGRKPVFILSRCDSRPAHPMFQQTVILMLPPTQPPLVAGIIINKPTSIPLAKLFRDPALKNPGNAYFGGPVELTEPLLLLRGAKPNGNASRLFDDVYVTTDPDSIAKLLQHKSQSADDPRVYFGRAQWTLDQLHAEILAGAWYVMPAKADWVFSSNPAGLWHLLLSALTFMRSTLPALKDSDTCALFSCAGESATAAPPDAVLPVMILPNPVTRGRFSGPSIESACRRPRGSAQLICSVAKRRRQARNQAIPRSFQSARLFCVLTRNLPDGVSETPDVTLGILRHVAAIAIELVRRFSNNGRTGGTGTLAMCIDAIFEMDVNRLTILSLIEAAARGQNQPV